MASDGEAILRRRARFLLPALAAALSGCPSDPPREPQPVVPVDRVDPGPQPTASIEPAEPKAQVAPPPAIAIPPGIGDELRGRYEAVTESTGDVVRALEATLASIPDGCPLADESCEGRWLALAERVQDLEYNMYFVGGACNDAPDDVRAFAAEVRRLREWLEQERAKVLARVEAAVGGAARWDALKEKARLSSPRACLSFACWK